MDTFVNIKFNNLFMEIPRYVNADNVAILVSTIALFFSYISYNVSKKELSLNRLNFKNEFYLGLSKLKELIELTNKIQNINPENITKTNFENDKLIIDQLLEKYSLNEEKIIKASYTIPNKIFEIKKTVEKLQLNFNNRSERQIYSPETEIIINYSHLFFTFSLLCSSFLMSELKVDADQKKLYLKFAKLSSEFSKYQLQLMNSKFKKV